MAIGLKRQSVDCLPSLWQPWAKLQPEWGLGLGWRGVGLWETKEWTIKGKCQTYFIWKAHQDLVQCGVVCVFTQFNSRKFGLRKAWTKLLFDEAVPNLVCLQAFQCCAYTKWIWNLQVLFYGQLLWTIQVPLDVKDTRCIIKFLRFYIYTWLVHVCVCVGGGGLSVCLADT